MGETKRLLHLRNTFLCTKCGLNCDIVGGGNPIRCEKFLSISVFALGIYKCPLTGVKREGGEDNKKIFLILARETVSSQT